MYHLLNQLVMDALEATKYEVSPGVKAPIRKLKGKPSAVTET